MTSVARLACSTLRERGVLRAASRELGVKRPMSRTLSSLRDTPRACPSFLPPRVTARGGGLFRSKENAVPDPKVLPSPAAHLAPGSLPLRSLPPILKADEVAALLRINRKTLYEAVQRGEVPGAFRIGRSLRFRRDAVLLWLSGDHALSQSDLGLGQSSLIT